MLQFILYIGRVCVVREAKISQTYNWHLFAGKDEFQDVAISRRIRNCSPFLSRYIQWKTDENAPVSLSTKSLERNTILGRCLTWINVFTIWCRCACVFAGHPQKIRNEIAIVDSASETRGGRWRRKQSTFLEKRRVEVAGGERVSLATTKKSDIVRPISLIRRNCL